MSSVELEAPGLWSCLYCEGAWIPGDEFAALSANALKPPESLQWVEVDDANSQARTQLICPDCGSPSFALIAVQDMLAHGCRECRGIYLPKAVLDAFQPKPGAKSAPEGALSAIALGVVGQVLGAILGGLIS